MSFAESKGAKRARVLSNRVRGLDMHIVIYREDLSSALKAAGSGARGTSRLYAEMKWSFWDRMGVGLRNLRVKGGRARRYWGERDCRIYWKLTNVCTRFRFEDTARRRERWKDPGDSQRLLLAFAHPRFHALYTFVCGTYVTFVRSVGKTIATITN